MGKSNFLIISDFVLSTLIILQKFFLSYGIQKRQSILMALAPEVTWKIFGKTSPFVTYDAPLSLLSLVYDNGKISKPIQIINDVRIHFSTPQKK
jgi:hypothetical protein